MNNLVKLLNYVTKEKKATQNNAEIITQSTAVKVDGWSKLQWSNAAVSTDRIKMLWLAIWILDRMVGFPYCQLGFLFIFAMYLDSI